ncbi:EAL domain-containing protein [Pseudoalteromonas sp. MMG022]|uniref:EAL domain-containing protein n=1 Tax=Pseudoalteromonas sp. MMG022 TaxID=2909978 RepID=UPI001F242A8C|nr:EAL domain-containing protein [Pseudoalteromonas sp. MMG022]MCF6434410.1 EAL domain-containing protein [Pseudoalteromonas sp. MMG022]
MSTSILNKFNRLAVKISANTMILSLREGYIALIPFFIVASLITLLNQWLDIAAKGFEHQYLNQFNQLVWGLFPLLSLISFSYHLAKNLKVHTIAAPILVITCFTATTGYMYIENNSIHIDHTQGVLYSLFMPIFCNYLLSYLMQIKLFRIVNVSSISLFLRKHINLIFPYMAVTTITLMLYPYIDNTATWFAQTLSNAQVELSALGKLFMQLLSSHMLWFLGVHGDNTYQILAPTHFTHYLLGSSVENYHFFSVFVLLGGTGCVWGIIIASFLLKEARHEQHIAKISLPLAVFNISEVMIYALPIVFNPYILLPFLLAPMLNAIVAYYCLSLGVITVIPDQSVPWFTPIFINAWLLTQSYSALLLQLVLVLANAAIYYPFLKIYQRQSMSGKALDMLVKRYSAGRQIEDKAESMFAIHHSEKQLEHHSLKQVTDALNKGALTLYYQPKIALKTNKVIGFEALLRLTYSDGSVQGPWFLDTLAKHNLLDVIDNYVIDQLEVDLERFASAGYAPKVSFNISPDNLLNGGYKRIVKAFSRFEEQVEVELLESSYIEDFATTIEVVNHLKRHHIRCAMDDFGTGYSCLSVLSKLNIDTIKLDRSLLPESNNLKSETLYKHLAQLCTQLGFKTVAEGVETREEERVVKAANIDCVQGFLYHQAMPIDEAIELLAKSETI